MTTYYIEKNKLKGEYKEIFEKVEAYSMLEGLDSNTDEDMMMNLLDLLYTAQVEGKPAEKIVGRDTEKFCKDYFQDFENKDKLGDRIKRIPNIFYTISWTIFILSIFEILLPEEETPITKLTIDISGIVFGSIVGIIISAVIVYAGHFVIFKFKRINATWLALVYLFIFFGAVMFTILWSSDRNMKIPLLYPMIISAVYIIIYKTLVIFKRYRDTGSIKKKEEKSTTIRQVWNSGMEELPIEFKKKWERQNKKRRRKGKPEITPHEFTEKIRRENSRFIYGDIILFIIYAVIYVGTMISIIKDSSVMDSILFGIIEFIILAALYRVFMFKKIRQERKKIVRMCDEENITMIDLADRIEKEKESP